MAASLTTPGECVARAGVTVNTANRLETVGDEWAAVCYFYAGYHLVRAALLADPVFSDLTRLREIDVRLTPDDREASAHQMRRGNARAPFGVNDLVKLLYPSIAVEYVRLHSASIAVRYGQGLSPITIASVKQDYLDIRAAYTAGVLVAS